MIKVSVLVYVLNDMAHIEKCICSVRNQTLREIEILVIDGGSTDGTMEFVKEMSAQDPRIHIICCASGVGLQFNTGLQAAKGEYIGICESDDYILPEMYERQYEFVKKHQLDYLKANIRRFYEVEGKEVIVPEFVSEADTLYGSVIFPCKDFRFLKLGVNGYWSGIYRREFLLQNKIFMNETKGAAYQDTSFAFMAAVKAERAMIIKDAFYCYRLDNPNSSVNSPGKMTMLLTEYTLLKKRLMEEGLFEQYKEIYLSWKIGGFLWFYHRLQKNIRDDYIRMMYEELSAEIKNGQYTGNELPLLEKNTAAKVKESFGVFSRYMKEWEAQADEMKKMLSQIPQDKSVMIFGKGNMGELVHLYLKQVGKTVSAFLDNNKTLWTEDGSQIPVMSPEKGVSLFPDAVYVIANVVHYEAIEAQLKGLMIKNEQIIVCNNYDVFLKEVLLKIVTGS